LKLTTKMPVGLLCVLSIDILMIRGSSVLNALLVLEGKFGAKKTRNRPRRTWIDDTE